MINDKGKNISEANGAERTLKEIISDAAERDFAQYPPVFMTPEKLEKLAADRKANKRKHRRKVIGGIAAMIALVLVGTLAAFNLLSVDVGADKNPKDEIQTEDGVVIEDGGYGASEGEDGVWSTNNWEEVDFIKTIHTQLLIPKYIPEEYDFIQLDVEQLETGDLICRYLFSNKKNQTLEMEIFYRESGEVLLDISDVLRTIECREGDIFIQEEDKNKMATIELDGGELLKIWADISDEEIVKIIDNCIL